METVQIVIGKAVLGEERNRSALVRVLREHSRKLEERNREDRDHCGYSRKLQRRNESLAWEREAAWPPG